MRGFVRPRGKDVWEVAVYLGREENGKRRYQWKRVKGKKRDADRELNRLLEAIHGGTFVKPERITTGEFLKKWLENYARNNVAGRTFERYEGIINQHLVPALGHWPLSKLNPLTITEYYRRACEPSKESPQGLSPTTVLQHHRVLREALKHAVQWGKIGRNPADAAVPPRTPVATSNSSTCGRVKLLHPAVGRAC